MLDGQIEIGTNVVVGGHGLDDPVGDALGVAVEEPNPDRSVDLAKTG